MSPTRGAQGNALKTILPMAYVLNEHHGEEASGKTIIEAHGIAHHIAFAVDHIKQEPKIEHTRRKPSIVIRGTRITVELPSARALAGDRIRHHRGSSEEVSASSPRPTRGSIRI